MIHAASHWLKVASQDAKYLVSGYTEPLVGRTYGAQHPHDIVDRIHPTKSWWSKLWCDECKRFIRYKTRHSYCRKCNKWMLAIEPECVRAQK